MLSEHEARRLIARAELASDEVPGIFAELSHCDLQDSWAAEAALAVAVANLELGFSTLIGLLDDSRRAEWAAQRLHELATGPELAGAVPTLDEGTKGQLAAGLETPLRGLVAVVCLVCRVEPERARDILVTSVSHELDDEDAYLAPDRLDYDLGCGLQSVVLALGEAPLNDSVVALLERIFVGADGPLTSLMSRSLIRDGAPVETLRRWRKRVASLEYSIDGYGAARLLELDVAIRYAEGASVRTLVVELASRPETRFFVQYATSLCVQALARVHPDDVVEALDLVDANARDGDEEAAARVSVLRQSLG